MDLAYLRAHPHHLPTFLTHQRIRETPVPGGSICTASRLTLDDGADVFAKTWPERATEPVPDGFFTTEAPGPRWLRVPDGPPVPEVIVALPQTAGAGVGRARRAHGTGRRGPRSGAGRTAPGRRGPTSGRRGPASSAPCPRTTPPTPGPWAPWFAERRLQPYLRAVDRQRRAHRGPNAPGRAGDQQHRAVRRRRAACPDPRRPVAGQRALGRRRPGLAGRPGRARRAPGDRPGPARALRRRRRTSTGSSPPTRRSGRCRTGWRHGCRCTSCTCCSCTPRCSGRRTGLRSLPRPMPRCGPDAIPSSGDHARNCRRPRRTGSAGWPPTCGSR